MHNVFKAHKLYVFFLLSFLINFLWFLCLLQSLMCLWHLKDILHAAKKKQNEKKTVISREKFWNRLCVHCERGSNKIDVCIVAFVVVFREILRHLSPSITRNHFIYALHIRHKHTEQVWKIHQVAKDHERFLAYRSTKMDYKLWINLTLFYF